MKKLCVVVGCISLIHFSCHKNHDPDYFIRQNPGLTIPGSKGTEFKVTEIYSKLSAIRRRIEVINQKTRSILGEVLITLGCNDSKDNLIKKIKTEPENFSGEITIETNHHLEFTKKILNGKVVSVERFLCRDPETAARPDGSCPFSLVNSCINNSYDDMNWLEYARCVVSGPFCYPKVYERCQDKMCS